MFHKIFAILVIVFLSPIFLFTSILIIYRDGFPIFFKQNRVGKNNKIFKMYKFRTMVKNAEKILQSDKDLYNQYVKNGYKLDSKIDPRILPFGNFLRSSSIDELPQFINVLKGDMNVVGPRPVVEKELIDLYGSKKDIYLSLRPGVTGLWQVSGRSNIKNEDRVRLDNEYYIKRNLLFDIKIIFKTVFEVFKRTGAY
jgi:lipopolysaccharide/colanic/teichoic acid biosynthesis glycosyltransferase